MADTPQIVFTDHDGNTYNIFTRDLVIDLTYDGITVTRQPGHVGITTDPIQEYETITCSCTMTGTALNTLRAQLKDATKTYDGTDPKIAVVYDGTNTWTILVATVYVRYNPIADNEWRVQFTFVERST
jgi:hypothetical protein